MGIGEIGERLRRSTVQVRDGRHLAGSGIIQDEFGAIVTNAHVVPSSDCAVELWDGSAATAHLERRDGWRDLAILRTNSSTTGGQPARWGDSGKLRVGELVIAVGNPLGFTGALSTGVVRGIGPVYGMGNQVFIQTTARLAPGNSGGPLADSEGRVIGINTAVISGGLGLAVPANAVQHLRTSAPAVELGVTVSPVRIPGHNAGIALAVVKVAPGSPADYASIRRGDVLIGANGTNFASFDNFRQAIRHASGNCLTLQFLREGHRKTREATVRLAPGLAA